MAGSLVAVVKYAVEVQTGSLPGGATEAKAYVHLFGTNGDAGRRALAKSNNKVPFRSGQTDVFIVEAVSLQTVDKVILGHNGKKKGQTRSRYETQLVSANVQG